MGVDFYCNNKTFGCSYTSWNSIRKAILNATYKYISNHLNNIITNEIISEGYDKEYNLEYAKNNLIYFNKIFNNGNDLSVDEFISNVFLNKDVWRDIFIEYNINGIYALCHKNDCEGYYSPGNALDICTLLDLIKNPDYFKEERIYDITYVDYENPTNETYGYVSIYKLFEESWKTNNCITIC